MTKHLCLAILALTFAMGGCKSKQPPSVSDRYQPVPIDTFAQIWSTELGLNGAKPTNSYFFENHIIIYTDRDTAHVVNRQTGQLLFINPLPTRSGQLHAPSVIGDRIIYPATSSYLVYNAKNGRLLGEVNVPFAMRTGGTGSGDSYYTVGDYPNGARLIKFDLNRDSGLPVWEIGPLGSVRAAPAFRDGTIFVAAEDGKVRAVNENRSSIWSADDPVDGAFQCGPVLADMFVDRAGLYIASTDTKLYSLGRGTGRMNWVYFAGVPLQEQPIATADSVYINVPRQGLTAISKLDGQFHRAPRWSSRQATRFLAEDEKHTYALQRDSRIVALDKATGTPKFFSRTGGLTNLVSNPLDGVIYAVRDGRLVCIKPVIKQGVVGEVL